MVPLPQGNGGGKKNEFYPDIYEWIFEAATNIMRLELGLLRLIAVDEEGNQDNLKFMTQ